MNWYGVRIANIVTKIGEEYRLDGCRAWICELGVIGFAEVQKGEPMADLIERDKAIDAVKSFWKAEVDAIPKDIGFEILADRANWVLKCNATICKALKELPSAQPEIKPIEYRDCANAMLRMWMDNVVTDGEYSHIMDKLNAYWAERRTDG